MSNHYNNDNYNDIIFKKMELTTQENILLKSLETFYKESKWFDLLCNIIDGNDVISRRTIEYFVTSYAFKKKITYKLIENNVGINFNVYTSYKDQLKAHKKKYFDPFGRGLRIPFFSKDNCIITTIGQLNFYRWFFSKKVYDYCLSNYEDIQLALLTKTKPVKKITTKNTKNKKSTKMDYGQYKQLTSMASNMASNIIVSFTI